MKPQSRSALTDWECHTDSECQTLPKCSGAECKCKNGVCEPGPCMQTPGKGGTCEAENPKWTFAKERSCYRFTYGGCGGNQNSFFTKEKCKEVCKI